MTNHRFLRIAKSKQKLFWKKFSCGWWLSFKNYLKLLKQAGHEDVETNRGPGFHGRTVDLCAVCVQGDARSRSGTDLTCSCLSTQSILMLSNIWSQSWRLWSQWLHYRELYILKFSCPIYCYRLLQPYSHCSTVLYTVHTKGPLNGPMYEPWSRLKRFNSGI